MKSKTTTPPDFDTLFNNLLAQMGGPIRRNWAAWRFRDRLNCTRR